MINDDLRKISEGFRNAVDNLCDTIEKMIRETREATSAMQEFSLVVRECTREEGHNGPCNGWPCAYIQKKVYGCNREVPAETKGEREARRQEAKYITTCDSGHTFNAMHQSGICPHVNIGEALWKPEPDKSNTPRKILINRGNQIH